ncbi:MAG: response regulator [Burkholderiaceae bacterium]|nr:response regulator [Burkholderiaceae bacterium]
MAEILVVDDEIGIRELLSEILGDEGHSVLLAESAQQARRLREGNVLDLVLLDIWMPDTDGVTLLKEWASSGQLTMPVIMMSGHATIDTAVEATRIGALDFLEKPIALQKLLKAVEQGLARRKAPSPPVPRSGVTQFVPVSGSAAPASAPAARGFDSAQAPPYGAPVANAQGAAFGAPQPGAAAEASVTLRELPLDLPLREARDAFERAYFEHHLSREHGSMTRVAEKTGLERTHLYRKLKQLGIDLARGAYRKGQSG